jgi:hypothetical protein
MSARQGTPQPVDLCRAVEDLRDSHCALTMATDGITASMHHGTADANGVYYLLRAVAEQIDRQLATLENLTGCKS